MHFELFEVYKLHFGVCLQFQLSKVMISIIPLRQKQC